MLKQETLTLDDAIRLQSIAIKKAQEIQSPSNCAVVDAGGHLISHSRMDNSQLASIKHAINKAYTSVMLKSETKNLLESAQTGSDLYGLNTTLGDRLIVFAGGIPIMHNQQIVGAIGISGGTPQQDQSIASFTTKKFEEEQNR